jgi:hypothetical protein
MHDIDSALNDIGRIRAQLEASTRFQGFAPPIVALTGVFAFGLASWQASVGDADLVAWVLLAAISATMIGSEAITRARKLHRSMADRLLGTTLQRFLPSAVAGAAIALIVLLRLPEQARLLPGLWQLLMGVGIFAALGNLPKQMAWAATFYLVLGAISLTLSTSPNVSTCWLMGIPFGAGQLLVAAVLHQTSSMRPHD